MNHTDIYNYFILSEKYFNTIHTTLTSIIIIIIAWYCNIYIQKAILKYSQSKNLEATLIKTIQNLTYIFVYAAGAILLLDNLQIQMSALFGTLGFLALGVSLSLQKLLSDITSGMLLLLNKPFCIGDYIYCILPSINPKVEGKIIDINLQRTTLEFEGNLILVPNSILYSSMISIKKQNNQG